MNRLLKNTQRVIACAVTAVFVFTLIAPVVALAATDLVPGDTAIVDNPNDSGANVRTDYAVVDDSTLYAELAEGTAVTIIEGPIWATTGTWYFVDDGMGTSGWVSATLLASPAADTTMADTTVTETATTDTTTADGAPEAVATLTAWAEPIDQAFVVDDNIELPQDGLAVRSQNYGAGEILGYAPVGTKLDVVSGRIYDEDGTSWLQVNFQGNGGFINGTYVVLDSELAVPATEAPVEAVPTEAPAEVLPTEAVPTEAPVEAVPTEAPAEAVPTEAPAEVLPTEVAPTEAPAEILPTEVAPTEAPAEVLPTEAPADVLPTEAVPTEAPADVLPTEAVPTEAPADVLPTEAVPTEAPADVLPTEAPADVLPTEAVPTEAPAEVLPTEAVPTEAPAEVLPTEAVPTDVPETIVPTATVAPTATVGPTLTPTPDTSLATSVDRVDANATIGSATVTGTTAGLTCRVSSDPASATITVLKEGTKVLVWANPVDGSLGIDCGGYKGWADVQYLYSGGAGDGDIVTAGLKVVVTGTGTGLNCRTSPSLSAQVIGTYADGTAFTTRGAASDGWTPVTCGGQNGFVYTEWIEPTAPTSGSGSTESTGTTPTTSAGGIGTVANTNGDGLYCRTGAGTGNAIITTLAPGATVAVRGTTSNGWVPVTCGGRAGWVSAQYMNVSSAPSTTPGGSTTAPTAPTAPAVGKVTVVNTGGQALNCRTGAGLGNRVITSLPMGTTVSVRSGSVSGWTAVVCGGQNGFVSNDFVSTTGSTGETAGPTKPTAPASGFAEGSAVKTTDPLNLRYQPNLGSGVAITIPAGQVIKVTGAISGEFYPVSWDGLNGFVHKDYIVATDEALSIRGGSGDGEAVTPVPTQAPTTPQQTPTPTQAPAPPAPGTSASGNALVNYAMQYLGYPYVWATHGPSSFDCSGFTYWIVYNVLGKDIGAGTWTQIDAGTPVSKDALQPGDLVFFQNTYTAGLSHVGMYIGNGQFIHAQNEDTGVVISNLDSSYYGPRWYGAVRITN